LTGDESDRYPSDFEYTIEWATRSIARFQTFRHLDLTSQDLFPELPRDIDVRLIVYAALDYVRGRDVLDADMNLLSALANRLEELGLDPMAAVKEHVVEGFELMESWSAYLDEKTRDKLVLSTNENGGFNAWKGNE
jgi:hypothetical protein